MDILHKMSTTEIETTIVPQDLVELKKHTGSIYKTLNVVIKRADQINQTLKHEIARKLEEFSHHTDSFDEVQENKEQIEISKSYETLPSPALMAIKELRNKEIYFRDEADLSKEL